MTALEFPQYDAKVAASLEGSAANAGGLPKFLGIQHTEVGAGVSARRGRGARRAAHAVRQLARWRPRRALRSRARDRVVPGHPARRVGRDDRVQDQLPRADHHRRARRQPRDIVSLTKRTAVVRIDVENEGRLACAAQGTVLVMAPKNAE